MISAHSISSASGARVGQELRAALRGWIVELATGGVGAEVVLVARQLKRGGVVVEPPRQARILRVPEVDAGVLVPVEEVRRERLRRALVFQRPIGHLDRALGDAFAIKTREHAGGATTVEAVAVVEDAQPHVFRRYQHVGPSAMRQMPIHIATLPPCHIGLATSATWPRLMTSASTREVAPS
jgi:hypothetical protein